jgi:hypothetical protein
MENRLLLSLLLLLPSTILATTITSATCQAGTEPIQLLTPSECLISSSTMQIEARSEVSSMANFLSVDISVEYAPGRPESTDYPASASASATVNDTLTTSGPVRLGYVDIFIANYDYHGGTIFSSISDGTHAYGLGNCPAIVTFHGCSLSDPSMSSLTPVMLPFTLGTTFTVSSQDSVALDKHLSIGDPFFAEDTTTLGFGLYEADGVTPVADTFVTPEPSTFSLSLLALVSLVSIKLGPTGGMALRPSVLNEGSDG